MMITTTDLGEMITVAVHAKNSGFKSVSVDTDHVLEIGVLVGKLVDFAEWVATEDGEIANSAKAFLKEIGE